MSEHTGEDRQIWSCSLFPGEAVSENEALEDELRRKALPVWEDARALERFLRVTGSSQAACARRLGRSQAAVANRLRLLKLPPDVIEALRNSGLTERHARALLRLSDPEQQRRAAAVFASRAMSVAQAESYVEALLSPMSAAGSLCGERMEALRRLLTHLEELKDVVPGTEMELRDGGGAVILTVRVPKG